MAKKKTEKGSSANLGFEAKLWSAADKLRNNMDAAEYKHVVLGLIFLKYISDTFEQHRAKLLAGESDYAGANPEDQDEYKAENVFWVPKEARWSHLQASAKQPTIGKLVDDAMVAIERDNPRLKGVLPKDYARPALDKHRLGELIDLIGTIVLVKTAQGEEIAEAELPPDAGKGEAAGKPETPSLPSHRSVDLLGRVYEYFLTQFASAEGKNGGQFYTPACVVRVLVEMITPYKGRIYDPCCGSGGMFVQSEKFVQAHGGKLGDIAIYGQESNSTTRRLAVMNLALRGIEADFGLEHADTFRRDLHADMRADFVLANPPFNDSDWFRKDGDVRWKYGVPPKGNANFAWVQHFIHHLSPTGTAGFVLANGSMSSNQSGEGDIRRAIIEADLVDCMVALPGQLFYSTPIPVCLWFLTRDKNHGKRLDRSRQTLFLDARGLGEIFDRKYRVFSDDEIGKIAGTYHAWCGGDGKYEDVTGFCKSASTDEIAEHGYLQQLGSCSDQSTESPLFVVAQTVEVSAAEVGHVNSLTVYCNPDLEVLRRAIAVVRDRLADAEAQYTREHNAVTVVQAQLFSLLRTHYQKRDRLKNTVYYRRLFLDAVLRGEEEDASSQAEASAKANDEVDSEYERAIKSAESKKALTESEVKELQLLYRKLVNLYHPDRFASDPEKAASYQKLTSAINQAKDDGDIETLREIASDANRFMQRNNFGSLDFSDELQVGKLRNLLASLEAELLNVIERRNEMLESTEFELYKLSTIDPQIVQRAAREHSAAIDLDIQELTLEASCLEQEIAELTGAASGVQ